MTSLCGKLNSLDGTLTKIKYQMLIKVANGNDVGLPTDRGYTVEIFFTLFGQTSRYIYTCKCILIRGYMHSLLPFGEMNRRFHSRKFLFYSDMSAELFNAISD